MSFFGQDDGSNEGADQDPVKQLITFLPRSKPAEDRQLPRSLLAGHLLGGGFSRAKLLQATGALPRSGSRDSDGESVDGRRAWAPEVPGKPSALPERTPWPLGGESKTREVRQRARVGQPPGQDCPPQGVGRPRAGSPPPAQSEQPPGHGDSVLAHQENGSRVSCCSDCR